MDKKCIGKSCLSGQNIYYKKEFRRKKCILKSSFGLGKIIKSSLHEQNTYCKSSLGGQNIYRKK